MKMTVGNSDGQFTWFNYWELIDFSGNSEDDRSIMIFYRKTDINEPKSH
jgi:hypothetical protein